MAAASSRALRSASSRSWYWVSSSTVVLRCWASWEMRSARRSSASVTAFTAFCAAVSASVLVFSASAEAVFFSTTLSLAISCMVSATACRASTFWTSTMELSPARVRTTRASVRSASESLVRNGVRKSSGLPAS